jgi:eukaryotic-like serine/threonine-protein kinase
LDPNFAWAYARMGVIYSNAGEKEKAIEYTRKAYELRDRVSEREKLYITSHYYQIVTGEEDKAMEILELYARTYPNDNNLTVGYRNEKELKEATDRLKRLEREQDQMNPLVYEELRQRREEEVRLCAAQLSLAHQKEAK